MKKEKERDLVLVGYAFQSTCAAILLLTAITCTIFIENVRNYEYLFLIFPSFIFLLPFIYFFISKLTKNFDYKNDEVYHDENVKASYLIRTMIAGISLFIGAIIFAVSFFTNNSATKCWANLWPIALLYVGVMVVPYFLKKKTPTNKTTNHHENDSNNKTHTSRDIFHSDDDDDDPKF
jgi:hypothetical protein